MESMEAQIMDFETRLSGIKSVYEDFKTKTANEMEIMVQLRAKLKMSYDYVKPESKDLKGKLKVLMRLPKSRTKTNAYKTLEEIQKLLNRFNKLRREQKLAMKSLKKFNSIFNRNAREFEYCKTFYYESKEVPEKSDLFSQEAINITSSSLPNFEWEVDNWKSAGPELMNCYDNLFINVGFDRLMDKFDKLLKKII